MRKLPILLCCTSIVAGFSCKERYSPDIISSPDSYLVIEGVLNVGAGPTSLRLTRTYKLDDTARVQGERNAQVMVEGKDNTTRQLTMSSDGIYTSPDLNLVINNEYRLRVTTTNGKEYLSDYVVAKKNPVIDSVGFFTTDKGVQVYVNTHDDSNNTRYYRWEYDETWEIRTYYNGGYKYVNGVVETRPLSENLTTCWKYDDFSRIIIGSTVKQQSDVVFRAPLVFIPTGDEKLDVRYSILVRQYVLDKQGFEFYEMMKKNTEGLGSIFDPQPSEVKGNIHCTSDPGELVIGYVSATNMHEKRFFIDHTDLPDWNFYQYCPEIPVKNDPDSIAEAYRGGAGAIYDAIRNATGQVTYYLFSDLPCVECPARGGSLLRPSYW